MSQWPQRYTHDQLLDALRATATDGVAPTTAQYQSRRKPTHPTASTIRNRLGSWSNACREANLELNPNSTPSYSRDDLLNALRKTATDGIAPTVNEYRRRRNDSYPHPETISDRFASWVDACHAAGLDSQPRQKQYTRDELLVALRNAGHDGHPPTTTHFDTHDGPASNTIIYRFGSWSHALETAGYDRTEIPAEEYSDEELLEWLRTFADQFGVTPAMKDIKGWPGPAPSTYQNRFGSWDASLKAAGLTPRHPSDDDS